MLLAKIEIALLSKQLTLLSGIHSVLKYKQELLHYKRNYR